MKTIKIKFDNVYDSVNVLILSDDKYEKKSKVEFPEDDVPPAAFAMGSSIYLPESRKKEISLLTHELIHAVKYIMSTKHIEDEEFLCYSVQYCLTVLIKKLKIEIK